MKGLIKPLLILAVLAGALYVLNPTKDDFVKYLQNKAETASAGKARDVTRIVSGVAGSLYSRDDKLFFSVYSLGPASAPADQYLGVAKLFIKTK